MRQTETASKVFHHSITENSFNLIYELTKKETLTLMWTQTVSTYKPLTTAFPESVA